MQAGHAAFSGTSKEKDGQLPPGSRGNEGQQAFGGGVARSTRQPPRPWSVTREGFSSKLCTWVENSSCIGKLETPPAPLGAKCL
jgi:hypothetical protein